MASARYLLLFVAISLGALGQVFLKTGAMNENISAQVLSRWTICGLSFYFLAAISYIVCLRYVPLSVAYPSAAMGYVVVVIIAHFLWGEELKFVNVAGIGMIVTGVTLLYLR